MLYVYDIETLPNIFTLNAIDETGHWHTFECSERRNDLPTLRQWVRGMPCNALMVGYNNLNFDWPVIDRVMRAPSKHNSAEAIFKAAQEIERETGTPMLPRGGIDELDGG